MIEGRKTVRPQGVRLVRANGRVVPIELSDGGVGTDGIHVWYVDQRTVVQPGDAIKIDVLPPYTRIDFALPAGIIERGEPHSRARRCPLRRGRG